jgi:hypothetical protein
VSTTNEIKIKKLLDLHVPGTIMLASWLEKNGFSRDLQHRYQRSGWLESIGVGAFKRPNENVNWQGAVWTMQNQAELPVFVGGPTALSLNGFSHYLRDESETIYLFSPLKTNLPSWFKNHKWNSPVNHIKTSFLPANLALSKFEVNQFSIMISSNEKAFFESLYLTPEKQDIIEVYQILSALVNLRPQIIQKLLEECTSVKVKRLFLYMAKKASHQWLQFLDLSKINLGAGDRSIIKNGTYNSEFQITIPKGLAQL